MISKKRLKEADPQFFEKNERLIPLANQLKEAWKKYYKIRTGKEYKASERYDAITEWLKMAIIADRIGALADDYVHAQFKFSKSRPFVNASMGETAIRNYYRYKCFVETGTEVSDTSKELNDVKDCKHTPAQINIMTRLLDLKYFLASNHYEPDLLNDRTRKYVLSRLPGLIDPLAAVILSPDDEILAKFGAKAKEELQNNPSLAQAMQELDMCLSLEYVLRNV